MKSPVVFFNASVLLSGIASLTGGSAKLLSWVKKGRIVGLVSEIIVDEAARNVSKLEITPERFTGVLHTFRIDSAPEKTVVTRFEKYVVDAGDAHVLASASEANTDFLVTLDKKHLLVLQNKIKDIQIVSPGELIEKLSKK